MKILRNLFPEASLLLLSLALMAMLGGCAGSDFAPRGYGWGKTFSAAPTYSELRIIEAIKQGHKP